MSANSPKLTTFNTPFARGLELYWHGEPLNEAEEREQAEFLVHFWNELVGVRPEYGRLTKAARLAARKRSVSGTAVSIHGLIAAASELHRSGTDIGSVLKPLSEPVVVDGKNVDYFSYDNPVWTKLGVLAVGRESDKGRAHHRNQDHLSDAGCDGCRARAQARAHRCWCHPPEVGMGAGDGGNPVVGPPFVDSTILMNIHEHAMDKCSRGRRCAAPVKERGRWSVSPFTPLDAVPGFSM